MKCKYCKFWNCSVERRPKEQKAECKRYPPVVTFNDAGTPNWKDIRPITSPYDWCG